MHATIRSLRSLVTSLGLAGALAAGGCLDQGGGHDHESEVITRVTLTFTPQSGGDVVEAAFSDPDGAGGVSGMANSFAVVAGTTYDLGVVFTNGLANPPEDITAEVEAEAGEHQIFFTGDGISGPAAGDDPDALAVHAYADTESDYSDDGGDDLPVGLASTFEAIRAGDGTLEVRLQHMPALNGSPQKTAGLAEQLADGALLPGDADVRIEFEFSVL